MLSRTCAFCDFVHARAHLNLSFVARNHRTDDTRVPTLDTLAKHTQLGVHDRLTRKLVKHSRKSEQASFNLSTR